MNIQMIPTEYEEIVNVGLDHLLGELSDDWSRGRIRKNPSVRAKWLALVPVIESAVAAVEYLIDEPDTHYDCVTGDECSARQFLATVKIRIAEWEAEAAAKAAVREANAQRAALRKAKATGTTTPA